jgi:signal transduction histidine kinase
MSGILETLMAAARSEADAGSGRSDLAHGLRALESQWARTLTERGVRLDVAPVHGPLFVGVDADIVERVVAPLLDNAGRYAASHVSVDASRDGSRVEIAVRDDGPGVAPEEAERVFEPGVRGERVNGHGGAGLGLALSRRLARAVGGDVSTRPGAGGATFVVELPA